MKLSLSRHMLLLTLYLCSMMQWAYAMDYEADTAKVLNGVDVYGTQKGFGIRSSQMSVASMSIATVRSVPAVLGETDIMKALQKLPGVQQTTDGGSGILIRGGAYDHNLVRIDGCTLYNAEHLGGFVSAINPDLTDNVLLYKGAFPARYGGRLSSIVEVDFRPGDMYKHHGVVNIGLLGAHVQAEGPIIRGITSYNIGARVSYMGLTVIPLYKLFTDNKDAVAPYSKMSFFDISAKLTYRASATDNIDLLFYCGKDRDDDAPTGTDVILSTYDDDVTPEDIQMGKAVPIGENELKSAYLTENRFSNLIAGARWRRYPVDGLNITTSVHFSRYCNRMKYNRSSYNRFEIYPTQMNPARYVRTKDETSYLQLNSQIEDFTANVDFNREVENVHNIRWGLSVSNQRLNPTSQIYRHEKRVEYDELDWTTDTVMGVKSGFAAIGVYIEDDINLTSFMKANLGLRYNTYVVTGKTYNEIEPRASMRLLMGEKWAVKASYSVMTQAIHQLYSSSIANPSDIWVPITDKIAPMKSSQTALGVNYSPSNVFDLSIEGYYKSMDNMLEYNEGASFASGGNWSSLVSMGAGKAYGVELMLQKNIGRFNGWLSYTWSKSLRKFDRPGQEINSGKEYYDTNDHRNNINIVMSYQLGTNLNFSASWSYITGRRCNFASMIIHGGYPTDFNPSFGNGIVPVWGFGDGGRDIGYTGTWLPHFMQFCSYTERNGFVLPAIHHLDISLTYSFQHKSRAQQLSFGIYNVYNRKNVTNVYMSNDEDGQTRLKGICKFPFMPSITYQMTF